VNITVYSRADSHSIGVAFDQIAIVRHSGLERRAATVEIRLLQIGAIVFWAKRIAISAVIAVIREIGDLIGLFEREYFLLAHGN
jgi:hypothetical protein